MFSFGTREKEGVVAYNLRCTWQEILGLILGGLASQFGQEGSSVEEKGDQTGFMAQAIVMV